MHKPWTALFACSLITIGQNTLAQTDEAADSSSRCVSIWEQAVDLATEIGMQVSAIEPPAEVDGWCVVSGGESTTSFGNLVFDRLRYRGEYLEDFLAATLDDDAATFLHLNLLDLEVDGLQLTATPGTNDRILALTNRGPMRMELALSRIRREPYLVVNRANISNIVGEEIRFRSRVLKFALTSPEQLKENLPHLSLMDFNLSMRDPESVLFAALLLPSLAETLGLDETVPTTWEDAKVSSGEWLAALDSNVVPARSKDAIRQLIADLPSPAGSYYVDVNFIGMSMKGLFDWLGIFPERSGNNLPKSMIFDFQYDRTP